MIDRDSPFPTDNNARPLKAAIVGGGKGCVSFLKMVEKDTFRDFRMRILAVADIDPDAPGLRYARKSGVPKVVGDYRDLSEIADMVPEERSVDLMEELKEGLPKIIKHVKRHDGEIRVLSEPGQGATFVVVLPTPQPARGPRAHAADSVRTRSL